MMGQDSFNGNAANVVQVYFELLPVHRLVDWMMEKVQTPEESQLAVNLMKLQGSKEANLEKIAELEAKVRANSLFHPITYQVVQVYLNNNPKVDMSKKGWWQKYLTADPLVAPATLSREGALQFLIDLGYVITPAQATEEESIFTEIDREEIAAIRFQIEDLKSKGKTVEEISKILTGWGMTEREIEAAMADGDGPAAKDNVISKKSKSRPKNNDS